MVQESRNISVFQKMLQIWGFFSFSGTSSLLLISNFWVLGLQNCVYHIKEVPALNKAEIEETISYCMRKG